VKRCPGCRVVKPFDAFGRDSHKTNGRRVRCRECQRRDRRAAYAANPRRFIDYSKRHQRSHSERVRAYRDAHKTETAERCRRWAEANPDRARLNSRVKARRRIARLSRRSTLPPLSEKKRCSKCRRSLPTSEFGSDRTRLDGLNAWCRECRRIGAATSTGRYRARKRSLPDTLTDLEWEAILRASGYRCAYCGRDNRGRTFHREHVIPASRGGAYSAENIVPSCHSCNSRKNNKTGDEFLALLALEPASSRPPSLITSAARSSSRR
jgi:5-methylcytosine-specific restriction endonuclease McrA